MVLSTRGRCTMRVIHLHFQRGFSTAVPVKLWRGFALLKTQFVHQNPGQVFHETLPCRSSASIPTRRSCLSQLWPVAPDTQVPAPRLLLRGQEPYNTGPRRPPPTSPGPSSKAVKLITRQADCVAPRRTDPLCARPTCTLAPQIGPSSSTRHLPRDTPSPNVSSGI